MPTAVQKKPVSSKEFAPGLWQKEINVRDFIQQNYEPYDGDESFLAPATERTRSLWERLKKLFAQERQKGVLDVSQIPSSITAHPPGYIGPRAIPGPPGSFPAAATTSAPWQTAWVMAS